MTAIATHANPRSHARHARADRAHSPLTFEALARPVKAAAAAVWRALVRWAVAYESAARERALWELAMSYPQLTAEIRAAQAADASGAAGR